MRPKQLALGIACIALTACASGTAEPQNMSWSYEGDSGPEYWGDLSPAYETCGAGKEQSPIDLNGATPAFISGPALSWNAVQGGEVVNNGHTLQVKVSNAGGLRLDGKFYELRHFHFRHMSEHTLNGEAYPMEVQFVHAAADGTLAILAVLVEEGDEHPALNPIWTTAPGVEGAAAVSFKIDPADFLPFDNASFHYAGSLTTPPCSEIVAWTVAQTPIEASRAQMNAFASLFPNNARPVQPRHRRYVLATP
ncbi:MAG: carbonic anhydrase family protein [Pseudomonadota bacterium]